MLQVVHVLSSWHKLKLALDSASQSYEVTKKNYDRTKALVDSGAAAQQQLDLAQQQLAATGCTTEICTGTVKYVK